MPTDEDKDKDTLDEDKPWRVDIDLIQGADFAAGGHFAHSTDALEYAEGIFSRGYVVQDRTEDNSNYSHVLHPVHNVRTVSVREHTLISGAPIRKK